MKTSSITRALAFASLLLLGSAHALQAQAPAATVHSSRSGILTGKLLDGETHEPIPFAHVVLLRASDHALIRTATTRADGSFAMAQVPFGEYSFRTTVLGYEPAYPAITFRASQTKVAMGEVVMQPLDTQLTAGRTAARSVFAAR